MNNQTGFTLIELMIVVAIIGILASIAVPQYQNFMARSQGAESIVLLGGAQTTIENEAVSTGTFLVNLAAMTAAGINVVGKYGSITGVDVTTAPATTTNAAGAVVYRFSSGGINENIKEKSVWLRRSVDGEWNCITELPTKFAPKGCTPDGIIITGS